jgi:colanic acid/amylovoran biosynthesis glycosyltransferase
MSPDRLLRRTGYVLNMYPRLSENFVVNEILALETAGEELDIFSLNLPVDGRFHESLADVRALVTYLPSHVSSTGLWDVLRHGLDTLPRLSVDLSEIVRLPVTEAAGAIQLAVAVRDLGITHLHAHFASSAADVARAAAHLNGITYSFTAHAEDIDRPFADHSADRVEVRRKLADASAVVTVSDYNLNRLRGMYDAAAARAIRIYNGLDLDRYPFTSPRERPPTVAAVGPLEETKGFTHVVDAISLLVRQGRDVRLDVVGGGGQEQGLRAQVTALGLDDHVRFLGAQPQRRVRETVRGAAALAAPCVVGVDGNRDGMPTVLLEAMALGTPCVSTPVGGIPEAVRHRDTGLLVPEADPLVLAAALVPLLDDADLRCRLAANARDLVEREFDVRHNTERLRGLFAHPVASPEPAVV